MRKGLPKKERAFLDAARAAWKKKSETFRQRFEQTSDPRVLVAFLEESPQALRDPWVATAISVAFGEGRIDFLRTIAASLKDKRKSRTRTTAILTLATALAVDHLVAGGLTQEQAFHRLLEIMRRMQPEQGWTYDVIRNRFVRRRRITPAVHVVIEDGWTVLTVGPTIINMNGRNFAGRWALRMRPGEQDRIAWTVHTLGKVSRTPPS